MSAVRIVARVLVLAVLCALATLWPGWPGLVGIGVVYGAVDRHARARGSIAAIGATLGWGILIGVGMLRGTDIAAVARRMSAVFQAPSFAFVLLTLIFAALLCGPAAVLGAAIWRGNILADQPARGKLADGESI